MAYTKYTKTSTFLFPLLGIPKSIFVCDVKNSFSRTLFTNRFVNAYVGDYKIKDYKKGFIFLLVRSYQDVDFDSFYDTMTAFDNYVDDYERGKYTIMIYSIPETYLTDYALLMDGKYSKISGNAKKAILQNNFFSGKPTTIPLILNKSEALRDSWEKRLGAPLNNQEVWPIILFNEEQICDDILEETVEDNFKSLREFKK